MYWTVGNLTAFNLMDLVTVLSEPTVYNQVCA